MWCVGSVGRLNVVVVKPRMGELDHGLVHLLLGFSSFLGEELHLYPGINSLLGHDLHLVELNVNPLVHVAEILVGCHMAAAKRS